MIICLTKISVVVTGGGANDADKPLNEEFFFSKNEAAEWIQRYLTYSNGDTKDAKHLKLVSNSNTYTITDYHSYVPIQVRNASATYITRFFHKHKGDNAKLIKEMITISYLVFKCNLTLIDQDYIDEHYQDVHGIEGGAIKLSHLQEIEVDTKIAFTLPSLQEIEQVGPDKRVQIISSVYTQCVSRGIIDKTSNKSESSLKDSRSKDLMTEL